MRDVFRTTMTQAQADGTLKGLAGVEIQVFLAGTTTPATVYQDRTGNGTGPSPFTGGVAAGTNGMTTGAGGAVELWLPAGVYDIHIRDTIVPARIATRGFQGANAPVQWNSAPMAAGAIPTTVLAQDGQITYAALAADVKRQDIQVGQVIDWWRPTAAVPLPSGFEICDGRQIAAGLHDFGIAGAINLPDLRNKFIIGADVNKTDGTGSSNGDGTAASGAQHPNAPGIGGGGGSNTTKDLTHQHSVPGHKHSVSDPGHGHGVSDPGHGHSASSSGSLNDRTISSWHSNPQGSYESWGSQWTATDYDYSPGLAAVRYVAQQYSSVSTGVVRNASVGVGTSIGGSGTGVSVNSGGTGITVGPGGAPNGDSALTTTGGGLGASIDMRPQHVGLLKLMKVRRA